MKAERLLLACLLTSCLAAPAGAQQQTSQEDRGREIAKELLRKIREAETASVAELVPPKRRFDHKIKITTEYDKFRERTDVQLAHTEVFRKGYKLRMTALYSYPGDSPSVPRSVTLAFNSTAPEWKHLRDTHITILADGRRYGPARLVLVNARIEARGNVTEAVAVTVGVESFLRIVNSGSVEMRVGDAEFSLEYKLLEALRDFASRMQP
jgi:hypothetical protein